MSARTVIVHGVADAVLQAALRAGGLIVQSEADGATVWGAPTPPVARDDSLAGGVPARRLLSVIEASKVLGVGRSTVYQLMGRGDIEAVHVGRCVRIPIEAIDDLMDRLRCGQTKRCH